MMMRRVVAAGACALAIACAPKEAATPPAPATPQEVLYTASEFAFTGPDTIAPGMTTVRLVNKGTQEHHLILGRLEEGKTMADAMAEMGKNPNSQPSWLKLVGAANSVLGNDSTGSTIDLPAGTYLAICFIPDMADGKAHVEKGMIKQLIVTGEAHNAPAPVADIELGLNDFSYDVPTITAGTHTIHVSNHGVQYHEAQLVLLDEGKTLKDFMAAMAPGAKGPPPGRPMGGSGALSQHLGNYWTVTLAPGNYAFICMVPDSADGTPHLMKGMAKEFTVVAAQ